MQRGGGEPECGEGTGAQHKRAAENLAARLGVKLFFIKYPEEIGLTDFNYEDYGHMVTSGALICTDWLAQQIRAIK